MAWELPAVSAFSALLGAVAAGAFTLLGSWIQSRREHRRWIRDRRFEAYLNAYQMLYKVELLASRIDAAREKYRFAITTRASSPVPGIQESVSAAKEELDGALAEYDAFLADTYAATAPIQLLGPKPVEVALTRVSKANRSGNREVRSAAHDAFFAVASRTLKAPKR